MHTIVYLQQHYTVRSLEVMAECTCTGHDIDCIRSNSTGSYECVCGGNTTGRYCDECLPFYNQQPFRYGIPCEGLRLLPVASLGGAPGVTPSRGWHPNESVNLFAAEFTRTMDKPSAGKAQRDASGDGVGPWLKRSSLLTTMTKKLFHVK